MHNSILRRIATALLFLIVIAIGLIPTSLTISAPLSVVTPVLFRLGWAACFAIEIVALVALYRLIRRRPAGMLLVLFTIGLVTITLFNSVLVPSGVDSVCPVMTLEQSDHFNGCAADTPSIATQFWLTPVSLIAVITVAVVTLIFAFIPFSASARQRFTTRVLPVLIGISTFIPIAGMLGALGLLTPSYFTNNPNDTPVAAILAGVLVFVLSGLIMYTLHKRWPIHSVTLVILTVFTVTTLYAVSYIVTDTTTSQCSGELSPPTNRLEDNTGLSLYVQPRLDCGAPRSDTLGEVILSQPFSLATGTIAALGAICQTARNRTAARQSFR